MFLRLRKVSMNMEENTKHAGRQECGNKHFCQTLVDRQVEQKTNTHDTTRKSR